MKNKKAVLHIEVIISFSIFIGLLFLIFLMIKPIREPTLSNTVLDVAEAGIKRDASIALTTFPFAIDIQQNPNNPHTITCFYFENPLNTSILLPKNVFIKDVNKNNVAFTFSGRDLYVQKTEADFYYIYYSFDEEFEYIGTTLSQCDKINDRNQQNQNEQQEQKDELAFSAPRTQVLFSYNKLLDMHERYYNNYADLKKDWYLPETSNFAIKIENDDILFEMTRNIPQGKEVFAREFYTYMIKDKKIEQVKVNLKVW
ncbi:MAG: hypothetical protein KJ767_00620 [Nanoarchaeota archaeon]|nr:hypothetical protein [Nanoarchaeota archaeon]